MDFFRYQEQARKNTKWLVVLYFLSVIVIVFIANIAAAIVLQSAGVMSDSNVEHVWSIGPLHIKPPVFWVVSVFMFAMVGFASLLKWLSIRKGGSSVAIALGGYVVDPDARDAQKKRLLNVVEEMALAAGMTVPLCYVLEREQGINAFAAGYSPADAVIGITRGALDRFDRDQLQGVVAHEFSHILNGDMRINMRLIALLNGIVFIRQIGSLLLRGSLLGGTRGGVYRFKRSRDSSKGGLAVVGFVFYIIGGLGSFFAGLIKAGVSRQREFLADASAVQFTRNPKGISQALQIIGGYSEGATVANVAAAEYSHLFFGKALARLSGVFSTHPALDDRIRRIDRAWDGQYLSVQPQVRRYDERGAGELKETHQQEAQKPLPDIPFTTDGGVGVGTLGTLAVLADVLIPEPIHNELQASYDAVALVFALLLDSDKHIRAKQLSFIAASRQASVPELEQKVIDSAALLEQYAEIDYLPILQGAFPALKLLTLPQYRAFKKVLLMIIQADQKITLREWVIYQLLRHTLEVSLGVERASKARYKTPKALVPEIALVLSLLAEQGDSDPVLVSRAFGKGANLLGLYTLHLVPTEGCDNKQFFAASQKLADSYPLLKLKLLKAFKACIENDGVITSAEKQLLLGLAAIMDTMLPDIEQL